MLVQMPCALICHVNTKPGHTIALATASDLKTFVSIGSCLSSAGETTHPSSEEPSNRYSVPGTGGPTVPLCPGNGPAKKLAAHVSVNPYPCKCFMVWGILAVLKGEL